jgi:putative ABC transport system substrate-binding protein
MNRREFLALAGAAAAWPLAGTYAQTSPRPVIGFLGATSSAAWKPWADAFEQRLRERGWIPRQAVTIEYRWADGRTERAAEIAAEFVHLGVDVIVTSGSALREAKQATSTIPIVFAVASDPVGSGFVNNLARPGGNVTGLSIQANDLATKRLDILRAALPDLRRLAVMANVAYGASAQEMNEVTTVARGLGMAIDRIEIQRGEEILPAVQNLKDGPQALYLCQDSLISTYRSRINRAALAVRLPTILGTPEALEEGGLLAYGPSYPELFRRAADVVDKILRGAKPGDIPVEQPTSFDLVINLKAAKELGLSLPPAVLALANEVIE